MLYQSEVTMQDDYNKKKKTLTNHSYEWCDESFNYVSNLYKCGLSYEGLRYGSALYLLSVSFVSFQTKVGFNTYSTTNL